MALDTVQKLGSAIGIRVPIFPRADDSIDQADRQQIARCYAGILSGVSVPVVPIFARRLFVFGEDRGLEIETERRALYIFGADRDSEIEGDDG